jgi:hypothetical protein
MFQIKGPGVMSARDWLDAKFGAGYHHRLCREVDPSFPERILPGEWYPLAPIIHTLSRASEDVDGVDDLEGLTEMLAAENAKNDLRGVYRAFLWVASPRMFLRGAPKIWSNYTDLATLSEIQNDPGRFSIQVNDIPEDYLPWVAGAWKGFLPPAIEMAGGKQPRATVLERKPDPASDGNWQLRYQVTYHG